MVETVRTIALYVIAPITSTLTAALVAGGARILYKTSQQFKVLEERVASNEKDIEVLKNEGR